MSQSPSGPQCDQCSRRTIITCLSPVVLSLFLLCTSFAKADLYSDRVCSPTAAQHPFPPRTFPLKRQSPAEAARTRIQDHPGVDFSKMLALMSTAKSAFLEIDNDRFKSIMKLSGEDLVEQKKDVSGDEDTSKTLQLLRIKGFPRLLPEGILALVNYCRYLRELSLSYSLLSDELLLALSSEKQVQLETLRLEAHPETKPLPRLSDKAWSTFSTHLPNINLVLLSYMTNEDDQNLVLAPHVPITHLYFGEAPSEAIVSRISSECPRLIELVIAAYGPGPLDQALISAAHGCSRLSAVGLGDCEITCSGLVEFVALCAERLRILYVWETSIIEDSELDIAKVSSKVSLLLGRTWVPEYIPFC